MEFSQISFLLVIAGLFGILAKFFKQPLIIGYLFAGIFLSFSNFAAEIQILDSLGQVGVALLLFLLGLEMKIGELPEIGKVALITAVGQMLITSILGFLIALLFGFETLPSIYIAIAISFSSTIIVVKLLSEKKDLSSLYGKISVGLLLVQDFVAVAILILLANIEKGNLSFTQVSLTGIKIFVVVLLVWVLHRSFLVKLFEKIISQSNELMFIVSISWALGIAAILNYFFGFTYEIGGFLAGLILSGLPEHLQIAARTRPLRDFFLTIFFVSLGAKLILNTDIFTVLPFALIISLLVILIKPLITLIILGFLGFKKRTSFLVAISTSQISEFSLILMVLGLNIGHLKTTHLAIVILIGMITMSASTYLILGADKIYKKFHYYLSFFERKTTKEGVLIDQIKYSDHIILVGCDRTGRASVRYFLKRKKNFIVVDFNPKVFNQLTAENIPIIFGDINDLDIIKAVNIEKAKMIISTISNLTDNLTLLEYLKKMRRNIISIFTASSKQDAVKLYGAKATYVIVPEVAAGEYIKHLFTLYGNSEKRFIKLGKNHYKRLLSFH
ncbi:hypothetical protein A2Z22_00380 [Candidatus Woesebacteria bacterium RBG_16_34_12]|uniref:Uncharacterized protein n=1 Tax=Candidatus Woesebacteria bacterium RBG_16_34_12 TaxID=1802480 RepID=A0A1F7X8X5_9BACT|nr:MAG: hypothetical protein A2Z22_00380 [Candidatus Woesebacteria bacterium RBG_16_34_12]